MDKDVKSENIAPKVKWKYEYSIWKPIFYSIRTLVVAWAIYDYQTWFAVVLGVVSFFSLLKEIILEAVSEVTRGNLAKVLKEHFDDNLDEKFDEINSTLEEIKANTE